MIYNFLLLVYLLVMSLAMGVVICLGALVFAGAK